MDRITLSIFYFKGYALLFNLLSLSFALICLLLLPILIKMSNINKTYIPKEVEERWYAYWLEKKFFSSKPDPSKEKYSVVIPPPNVTGVLHMGHMLNNTIQDVLVRKARMEGKEACWVPGTDHASIATEAKVVAMLKEKGIKKSELSREDFLKYAWEWKEKYGGIILEQLKKLGASCDWDRTRFTMEPDLSDAVIEVFVKLYESGLIYKGFRMVNWDPQGKTALSDEEVIHKEVNSKLYYVKYLVAGSKDYIKIATTRPETILGDTAVCINPNDERYKHLKGKKVIVPLANREVPVIFDEYVDMEFGTGCLKVTPAHDVNDYNLGQKHKLEVIDIFTEEGILNAHGLAYAGMDRFAARKKVAKDLEEAGLLEKIEDIKNNVGYSERTDAVIEPRLSSQWFVDMKKFMEKNPQVLDAVMSDEIAIYPAKFKNTYRHWIGNIKDWCISRQLWWGQRIPAYYLPDGTFVVAKTVEEALSKITNHKSQITIADLRQDEDVLDTWFSSWLWPISVFDGFKDPDNKEIKYYYPTDDLVTAPEILFFWVARMIMAGYEFKEEKPFKNVYLTGIVRDKQGRKMSKSLGNSPDPLDLIEKHGADGVRVGMLLSSPAGNDLLFDEKLCEQGSKFRNKIWNAFLLVKGWNIDEKLDGSDNKTAIEWFETRFNAALIDIEDHYKKYRLSDALMSVYKLIWDDFCSWYLEMIKPGFEQPIDKSTYEATIAIFEKLMKIAHPFIPFITEEIWHEIKERKENDCILVAQWPQTTEKSNDKIQKEFEVQKEIVRSINNYIQTENINKDITLEVTIYNDFSSDMSVYSSIEKWKSCIIKLSKNDINLKFGISLDSNKKYHKTPLPPYLVYIEMPVKSKEESEKIKSKILEDIEYNKGFLAIIEKKLSNERFVNGASPKVLELEKQKKADAEAKIKALEESLAQL
jgi:valyl-tRNA synthetase